MGWYESEPPERSPMGEVSYYSATGTVITISAQSNGSTNMVKAAPTTDFTSLTRGFDNGGANNGRLRYIEGPTRMFHCALTWSLSAATANDQFVLAAFKNDALVAESRVINTLASAAIGGSAIHAFVEMATNDYIELFVGNLSGARNATIYTLNIFAMGMK